MSLFEEDNSRAAQRRRDKRVRRDAVGLVRDVERLTLDAQADVAGRALAAASPSQIHIELATVAEYEDLVGITLNMLLETEHATSRADRPKLNIQVDGVERMKGKQADRIRACTEVVRAVGSYKRAFPDEWSSGAAGSLSASGKALAQLGARGDPKHDASLREAILDEELQPLSLTILLTAVFASPAPPARVARDFLKDVHRRLEALGTERSDDKAKIVASMVEGGSTTLQQLADLPMHPMAEANASGRTGPSRPAMTG